MQLFFFFSFFKIWWNDQYCRFFRILKWNPFKKRNKIIYENVFNSLCAIHTPLVSVIVVVVLLLFYLSQISNAFIPLFCSLLIAMRRYYVGQHSDPRCIYVPPSSGKTFYAFRIAYARCGTKPDLNGQFYENTVRSKAFTVTWLSDLLYLRRYLLHFIFIDSKLGSFLL